MNEIEERRLNKELIYSLNELDKITEKRESNR
jgi:hypothetical protein